MVERLGADEGVGVRCHDTLAGAAGQHDDVRIDDIAHRSGQQQPAHDDGIDTVQRDKVGGGLPEEPRQLATSAPHGVWHPLPRLLVRCGDS